MTSKLSLVLLSILLIGATKISSNFVEEEKLENLPAFTYYGNSGPGKWGKLCPQYSKCGLGTRQSPVNIDTLKVVRSNNLGPLIRHYKSVNSTLVNNGFNVGVHYEDEAGFMEIYGQKFTLVQMHWHSPSEHKINGVQFPAELHLVHRSEEGNLSVVAILFKYSSPDPLLATIKDKVDELAKEVKEGFNQAHVPLGTLDLKPLRTQTRKYYRYVGSLTTPPCSEKVIWNILGKARCISREQVNAIKAPLQITYKSNARPCQPLNGRPVELYDQHLKKVNDEDD